MKKYILLFIFSVCALQLFSQYSLRMIVTEVATRKLEDIYLAGNFNNWNPVDPKYKLKPFGTRRAIVLKDIPAGKYEFKFTRGGWNKVETTAKGEDVENHIIEVNTDTSVNIIIEGWKDD